MAIFNSFLLVYQRVSHFHVFVCWFNMVQLVDCFEGGNFNPAVPLVSLPSGRECEDVRGLG